MKKILEVHYSLLSRGPSTQIVYALAPKYLHSKAEVLNLPFGHMDP